MNRRTHRNHSSSKTQARIARVKDKLQKLRDRVRRSAVMFWERRQARLTWWQQAFRTPMASGRWVFSQSRTLWSAFLTLLGLAPSGRARLLARSSDIRGNKARKAANRNHLILEGLEQRQLLAADLYVDDTGGGAIVAGVAGDYAVTNDQGAIGTLDTNDTVTWGGPNGVVGTGGDDVPSLNYGAIVSNKGAFGSIQDAIIAASDGDTIHLAPGTYAENLTISKAITILGPNSGIAGNATRTNGEASITGWVVINAASAATIDGVEFRPASMTTGSPDGVNSVVNIGNGNNHQVKNSIFYSTGTGGGTDLRAIMLPTIGSGAVTISNNLVTGNPATAKYSTANWGRGIWTDGGGATLNFSSNEFFSTRTGMNLDDTSALSPLNVTNNSFHVAGTGISLGANLPLLVFTGNVFDDVDTDVNARNVVAGSTLDISGSNSAVGQLTAILGGPGNDDIVGTQGKDVFDANNLNLVITNDRFKGLGDDDEFYGKTGIDTSVYTGNRADYSVSIVGSDVTVVDNRALSPDGTDTLHDVEVLEFADVKVHLATVGSYATIQDAINGAATGDIVFVPAGTYVADVNVNKEITLEGAGASTTTISGAIGGADGATIRIAASNVTVKGFTITREGNNTTDWNDPNLNFAGIAIQGQALSGTIVEENIISGNRTGVDVNNSNGHTFRNNVLDNNHTGMIFRNQTDNTTVTKNAITNNRTVGVLFLDASGGTNVPVQQALNSDFTKNNFSGNWYGQIVDRQVGGSLPAAGTTNLKNFSNNWFGTTAPVVTTANSAEPGYAALIPVAFGGVATAPGGQPDIAGPASANFDYSPFLNSGSDISPDIGFQGDFSNLIVHGNGAQVQPGSRIQEAYVDLTPTGTIQVRGGASYPGNVDLSAAPNKDVVLSAGASPAQIPVVGNYTLNSGDTLPIEILGTNPATQFDNFVVTGSVSLGGATLTIPTATVAPFQSFMIIDNDAADPVVGTFAGLAEGALVGTYSGLSVYITYQGGTGNDVVLFTAIPVQIASKSNTAENLSGNFQLSIPSNTPSNLLVYYTLSGTATEGGDYPLQSGTATIAAGTSFTNIPIAAALDGILEPTENVTLSLTGTGSPGVSVGPMSSDSILIFDGDKGQVNLSVSDGSISEVGDTAGQFMLRLQDTLANPLTSTTATTVTFSVGGTATPGSDYVALSTTTAVIPAGSSQVPINITALNDTINFDNGETIILSIVGPIGTTHPSLTVGNSPATITISDPTRPIASVSAVSTTVSEGGSASFLVSLNSVATDNVTLALTLGGGATPGTDYTPASTTVIIPTGSSTQAVTFAVTDDTFTEDDETIAVGLSYIGGNVALDGNTTTATIAANDPSTLSISAGSVTEGNTGTLTFSLTNPANVDTTFTFGPSGGTAGTADYTLGATSVVISASATMATVPVTVPTDSLVEGTENLQVSLTGQTGGPAVTLSPTAATLSILDANSAAYSVTGGTVSENAGTGDFTISIDTLSQNDTTVTFAVAAGTALAGSDYTTPAATTAIISAGSSSVLVPVTILDNSIIEPDETLTMSLSGASDNNSGSYTSGSPTVGTLTIDDNDTATINITALTATINEPAVSATQDFLLYMTNPSDNPVTVTLSFGGDATGGASFDYTPALSTVVSFAANQQILNVPITFLGDTIVEGDETVIASITGAITGTGVSAGSIVAGTAATMTIIDDDSATVALSSSTVTVTEGGTASLTLTQSALASTDTTISYNFVAGSASAADVTNSISGTAVISSGSTQAVIAIDTVDDTWAEATESFTVSLVKTGGDSSISLTSSAATVVVNDNDTRSVSISGPTSVTESTVGPQTLTYTVALSGPSQEAVTVHVKTTDGTASSSTGDYNAEDLTVTLAANTTAAPSTTFTVVVNDDALVEGPETLTVGLVSVVNDNGTGATLGGASITTLTISDNDSTTLSVTSSPSIVNENVGNATFTIALSSPAEVPVVINYETFGNTATNTNDYTGVFPATAATFTVGETTKLITVPIVDDPIDEAQYENFRFGARVVNPNGASVALASPTLSTTITVATLTIEDNDDSTVSVTGPASVTEGSPATFTIARSPSSAAVTVYYETVPGSASTLDYTPVTSSVVIAGSANSTLTSTSTFVVATNGDALVEGPETFSVSLTSVSGANSPVLGTSIAQVTITDDDSSTLSVSGPTSVTEGVATTATFTLALTTAAEVDTTVTYSTVDGSALAGSDYTATSSTAIISASQTSVTVPVSIINDNTAEGTENFSLSITGVSSSASIVTGTSSASVSIVDDDVATASVSPIVNAEETVSGTIGIPGGFLVSLTNTVDVDTTVTYSVGGSATPGTDYTAVSTTVIVPMGSSTAVVYVNPVNDTLVEGNEDVVVALTGITPTYGGSVTYSSTPATVTIIDNDSSTLSITGGTVSENVGTATFTLNLSNPSATDTTVFYSLGGSATPTSDFTPGATTGSVVISASVTSVPVVMTINDDSLVEGSETIILTATSISGMVSGVTANNTITIQDNDQAQIKIIPSAASVTEAGSPQFVVFTDKLAQDAMTVTVNLSGMAQPGSVDYTGSATRVVTIPAMSSSTLLSVSLVDDSLVESTESLIATLSTVTGNATSLTIGSPSTATISITDNDSAVINVSNPTITVSEGVGSAVVTVTLSNPSDTGTVVSYTMTDGSASSTLDYTASSGTISFAPSATLATISVPINNDSLVENTETFMVNLTSLVSGNTPAIALGGTLASTISITDNDSATISVPSAVTITEGTGGSVTANVTISQSAASSQNVTVTYSTADGTATAGSDYTAQISATAVIPAGSAEVVVPVSIATDSLVEGNETFSVSLSGASGHPSITVGGANVSTVSIIDDDSASVTVTNPTVTVAEGNVAVFTLSQSSLSASDTVISYAFTPGTALAADVTGTTNGLATISMGQSTAVVSISTFNDTIVEQSETFTVALSKVSGNASVSLATTTATATITDSDMALLRIFAADGSPSQNVPESAGNAQRFYLSLTAASSTDTTVTYNISGDATSGTDYGAISSTAIIPAGTTSLPISISITDDNIVENNETISLSLTSSSNSSITIQPTLSSVASAVIVDNDGAVTASVTPIASTITEGASSGFLISLSAESGLATTVTYNLVPSASLTTADYTSLTVGSSSVVIPAGTLTATVNFGTVDDTLLESNETLTMSLTGASGVTSTTYSATAASVVIEDNDTASLAIVALQNGSEAGPTNGIFQIQLTHPADTATTVSYSVEGSSTATPGGATDDYIALSGTAVIPAGSQSVDVTVAVNDDSLVEGSETVVLKLQTIVSGDPQISIVPLANDMATVTIADDDGSFVSVLNTSVNESVGNAVVTLSLSNPSINPIIVSYTVTDGSAKASSLDYTVPATLTASFSAGATTTTVTVPIGDDSLVEGSETFNVSLTSLVAGGPSVSLSPTAGVVTIADNDNDSTVSITGGSSTEGSDLVYTVSLSKAADQDTTLTYSVGGGSAEAADYTVPATTTVVVPANSLTAAFNIATTNDSFVEGNETLQVTLTSVSGAYASSFTLSPTPGTATIVDNDAATATITAITAAASETGPVDGLFRVTLSGASDEARTVHYNIGSGVGSATNSADYTSIASFAVVSIGQTTADIPIAVINDTINELSETVVLTLTSVSTANEASLTLATVDTTPATVTIADNDLPIMSVNVSNSTISESGGPTTSTITFQLDQAANEAFTLTYGLGGSASLADDFTSPLNASNTVSFTVGQSSATVVVTAFNDTFVEGNETLTVSLTSISGATTLPAAIGTPATSTITIKDDDNAFLTVVKLNDGADPEIGPTVNGVFYVNLTKPSQTATTISYSVAGTANNTPSLTVGDYTPLSGTLVLTAGQTDAFITINVLDDTIVENDETVILKLESITAGNPAIQIVTTGNEIATLTITDADTSKISVVSLPTSVTEGGSAVFQVQLSACRYRDKRHARPERGEYRFQRS
ncbi:MAG: Calx-beta domain-containing protein [Pirellulaceae bacterium]